MKTICSNFFSGKTICRTKHIYIGYTDQLLFGAELNFSDKYLFIHIGIISIALAKYF